MFVQELLEQLIKESREEVVYIDVSILSGNFGIGPDVVYSLSMRRNDDGSLVIVADGS